MFKSDLFPQELIMSDFAVFKVHIEELQIRGYCATRGISWKQLLNCLYPYQFENYSHLPGHGRHGHHGQHEWAMKVAQVMIYKDEDETKHYSQNIDKTMRIGRARKA